jgi:hypothetical protein
VVDQYSFVCRGRRALDILGSLVVSLLDGMEAQAGTEMEASARE